MLWWWLIEAETLRLRVEASFSKRNSILQSWTTLDAKFLDKVFKSNNRNIYFKKLVFKTNYIHPDQWISSFLALIISNSKYQGEMLAFICPIGCKHPFTPHAMTKFPQEDEVFSICDINGDRVSLSGRRKILLHLMMIPFSIFKINRTRNFFDNGTLLSRFYSQSLREFRT